VIADQSFIMYGIAVRAMAAPLTRAAQGLPADLEAMAAAARTAPGSSTSDPNNPTGTHVSRADSRFFRRVPGTSYRGRRGLSGLRRASDYPCSRTSGKAAMWWS